MGSLVAGWSAGNKGQFGIAMHELLHLDARKHRQQLNPSLQQGRASTSVNVRNACVLQGYSDHGLRPLDSAIRFALRGRLGLSGKILIISHVDHISQLKLHPKRSHTALLAMKKQQQHRVQMYLNVAVGSCQQEPLGAEDLQHNSPMLRQSRSCLHVHDAKGAAGIHQTNASVSSETAGGQQNADH